MKTLFLAFLLVFALRCVAQGSDEPPYSGPNLTQVPSPVPAPKKKRVAPSKKAPPMKSGGAQTLGTISDSEDAKADDLLGCKIGEDKEGKPILDPACE